MKLFHVSEQNLKRKAEEIKFVWNQICKYLKLVLEWIHYIAWHLIWLQQIISTLPFPLLFPARQIVNEQNFSFFSDCVVFESESFFSNTGIGNDFVSARLIMRNS